MYNLSFQQTQQKKETQRYSQLIYNVSPSMFLFAVRFDDYVFHRNSCTCILIQNNDDINDEFQLLFPHSLNALFKKYPLEFAFRFIFLIILFLFGFC